MTDEDPNPTTDTKEAADQTASDTADGWDFLTTEQIQRINRLVPGTLTLHFARRDVSVDMNGSDAVRILTAHRRGRPDDLGNELDPQSSLMLLNWLSVDLDKILVVSWHPGPDADKVVAAKLIAQREPETES